jgi:probable HAF family extracellular repeat protein
MRTIVPALLLAATSACNDGLPATRPTDVAPLAAKVASIRYDVVRLPHLGGTDSRAQAINNRGSVAGFSRLPDGSMRAVLWPDHHTVTSLGTLGGPHSSVVRNGLNNAGVVVGLSHSTDVDVLNELWSCEGTGSLPATDPRLACRGFWWEKGVMQELATLGGTHAFANSVNERGLAVGWAETDVHDPTCTGVQVLQFHGALWDLKKGTVKALRPFPGDSSAAATGINARGQVIGISGDCDQAIGRLSARRAVLWEGDRVIEIPNLGGTSWHTPWAINARGDVVGFGNPEGTDDEFHGRAFFWRYGVPTVTPLGVLEGDLFSQANGINARGQVIGVSHGGPAGARGFIWEQGAHGEGVMTDLNELIELGPDEVFELAHDLNDSGQIAGRLLNTTTNERTAVVLIPRAK